MHKIVIGQAGGPTAVINASLVGLVEGLYGKAKIYPVNNGYQGLAHDKLEEMDEKQFNWIKEHQFVPGACLGSGRFNFTPELMEQAVHNMKKHDIHTVVFIGGNGTMAALERLSQIAQAMGYELQTIGIPKTVDNDLGHTDHAPGFASAARYIAQSVRNIVKDLEAMRNFEQVRVIETMGRNAGWLALSSGFLRASSCDGPHHIYIPEVSVTKERFIADVESAVKSNGITTIVVSEGFALSGTAKVERQVVNGRLVLGGIANQMEQLIQEHLGYVVRSENLGMNQRSASYAVSLQDRKEAYEVGKQAAQFVLDDMSSIMVNIQRQSTKCYNYTLGQASLTSVAKHGERLLPESFISDVSEYYAWLEPLMGEPITPYPASWR